MIDIPIGKAMVAVEVPPEPRECEGCMLVGKCTGHFGCMSDERKDGKNMIFKLVDWPGEIAKNNSSAEVMPPSAKPNGWS